MLHAAKNPVILRTFIDRLGKHKFTFTHSFFFFLHKQVKEGRNLSDVAKRVRVATQMLI